ncbi:hypothetical protein UFOVP116_133 [uncultured Caudovirales phage]|uniref:Uncharacterized protein n=1 Tax=uncultured Caudovirales phage TaxID=2100421 RepID=A0A6J5L9U8_9CAUD|nr:hypothetical protein UFOVP116_133 [uncultured Caudovirales phage]
MAARKTIEIATVVDHVNRFLRYSAPDSTEHRTGAMLVLESILQKSDLYSGFRYLTAEETTGAPGVHTVNGEVHPDINVRFKDTDGTRVHYFCKQPANQHKYT